MVVTALLLLLFKSLCYLILIIGALVQEVVRAAVRRWFAALAYGGILVASIVEAISRH